MTKKCLHCSKTLDTDHDAHYYCQCDSRRKVVCSHCFMNHSDCPDCYETLQLCEESITKKTYFNPASRSLRGF